MVSSKRFYSNSPLISTSKRIISLSGSIIDSRSAIAQRITIFDHMKVVFHLLMLMLLILILLDIKYATADNFVEEKMYDCGKCFLRPEVARAMVKAQAMLREQGYGLLMYDCYRPKPFQQKLWDKVPDPRYVSPPGSGSMHGRGLAVDLTLVDAEGNLMDMGTGYDFFGERAYQTFEDLPSDVLANRKLLNKTMEAVGLSPIRTEWWHFSMRGLKYEGSDWVWPCP